MTQHIGSKRYLGSLPSFPLIPPWIMIWAVSLFLMRTNWKEVIITCISLFFLWCDIKIRKHQILNSYIIVKQRSKNLCQWQKKKICRLSPEMPTGYLMEPSKQGWPGTTPCRVFEPRHTFSWFHKWTPNDNRIKTFVTKLFSLLFTVFIFSLCTDNKLFYFGINTNQIFDFMVYKFHNLCRIRL